MPYSCLLLLHAYFNCTQILICTVHCVHAQCTWKAAYCFLILSVFSISLNFLFSFSPDLLFHMNNKSTSILFFLPALPEFVCPVFHIKTNKYIYNCFSASPSLFIVSFFFLSFSSSINHQQLRDTITLYPTVHATGTVKKKIY